MGILFNLISCPTALKPQNTGLNMRKILVGIRAKIPYIPQSTMTLGAIKAILERMLGNISRGLNFFNTIILLKIAIDRGININEVSLLALVLFPLIVIFTLIETFVLDPQNNRFTFDRNPPMVDMRKDIKWIKKHTFK